MRKGVSMNTEDDVRYCEVCGELATRYCVIRTYYCEYEIDGDSIDDTDEVLADDRHPLCDDCSSDEIDWCVYRQPNNTQHCTSARNDQ
jgi:hypothetical protein